MLKDATVLVEIPLPSNVSLADDPARGPSLSVAEFLDDSIHRHSTAC
jgi:hypothetical protein